MFKTNAICKGRLTRDPETNTTNSGVEVTKFTLACDEYDFSKKEKVAHFIDCVAFSGSGAAIAKYCKKGSELVVTGRIEIKEYESKKYWNESGAFAKMKSVSVNVESFEFCGSGKKDDTSNGSSTGSSNLEPIGNDDGALPF